MKRWGLFGVEREPGNGTKEEVRNRAGWAMNESSEIGRQIKQMFKHGEVVYTLSPSTLHAEAGISLVNLRKSWFT